MEWRRELAEKPSSVRPYLVLVRTRFSVGVTAKTVGRILRALRSSGKGDVHVEKVSFLVSVRPRYLSHFLRSAEGKQAA